MRLNSAILDEISRFFESPTGVNGLLYISWGSWRYEYGND